MFGHHQMYQRSQLSNHHKRVKHLLEIEGKQLILQHFANTLTIDLHPHQQQPILLSAKYTEIPQDYNLLFNSLFHLYQSLLQYSHTATLQGNNLTFSITALQQSIPITLTLHPRMVSQEEVARHQMVRLQLEIALMVSRQRRYQMRTDEEARQIKMAIEQERKSIAEMDNIEAELVKTAKEKEAEIIRMREYLGKTQKQMRELSARRESIVQIDDA